MFGKMKNSAKIRNGSNNTILQNVNIYNNTSPLLTSTIPVLSQNKDYQMIQATLQDEMRAAKKAHPLYPLFTAKWDNSLERLVSSAETEEALKRYPKKFEEKVQIDPSKYPNINPDENIFEYAYRTQTKIECQSLGHKEFLGELEDPFPQIVSGENATLIITPPDFPPALKAHLVSGDSDLEIFIRRKPSQEYGVVALGNTSTGHGFDIDLTFSQQKEKSVFTIQANSDAKMEDIVAREKMLVNMVLTKKLIITIDNHMLAEINIGDEFLSCSLLKSAQTRYEFYSNLLIIEKNCNCTFNTNNQAISQEEFECAYLVARSLHNEWLNIEMEIEQFRCDYNSIHLSEDQDKTMGNVVFESSNIGEIELLGKIFRATKYINVCHDAKINNIESVRKRVKQHKKNILISIKSKEKNKKFIKSSILKDVVFVG